MKKSMIVEVQNVTDGEEKWVVARFNKEDGKFWYWGRWKKEEDAKKVADELGGVVFKDVDTMAREKVFCPNCGKELTDFDIFMKFCPLCMKTFERKDE